MISMVSTAIIIDGWQLTERLARMGLIDRYGTHSEDQACDSRDQSSSHQF
jgi:hypothetical protein